MNYDVDRFRRERLCVEFSNYCDVCDFIDDLKDEGGFGVELINVKINVKMDNAFKEAYKIGHHRYYWSKARDRLFACDNPPEYYAIIPSNDLLLDTESTSLTSPDKSSLHSFLFGTT